MLAYFTASVVGKKYHLANYHKIVETLEGHGIEVIAEHIFGADEKKILLETKEQRINFHAELEKWINQSDFMVVECTFPSISVGYEIALALARGKPILILYGPDGEPPSLLASHESERIVCEKYTPETLNNIIVDFVMYAKGGSDTRFTFFLTSQLAAYLEKAAKKTKVPKSVYLRQLLETDLKKSR